MSFLASLAGPVLGSIVGGIFGNNAQKAQDQSAQNAAQAAQAQQYQYQMQLFQAAQQYQQQQQQALRAALMGLAGQGSPYASAARSMQPTFMGPQQGAAMFGGGGLFGVPQGDPGIAQALAAARGAQGQMQTRPPQPAPPSQPLPDGGHTRSLLSVNPGAGYNAANPMLHSRMVF